MVARFFYAVGIVVIIVSVVVFIVFKILAKLRERKADKLMANGQVEEAVKLYKQVIRLNIGKLDSLLESFSRKIEDPVRKKQFQADVEKWKWINNLSLKEFRLRMISDLRQELPNAKDERAREWLTRWLEAAESPSLSTEDRLRSWRSVTNQRQLREIIKTYAIPGEVLADVGVHDPREGMPRFD